MIAAITAEVATLKRQLGAQKGAATRARNQMEEMVEASKPRALGPIDPKAALSAADLMLAIDTAEEVVLAFSNGREELRGISPRKVSPEDFRLIRGRVVFHRDDLIITGPGGDPAPQLAGVALLLDGDQFDWSAMVRPVDMGAGQALNLAGSVVFG